MIDVIQKLHDELILEFLCLILDNTGFALFNFIAKLFVSKWDFRLMNY